MMRRMRKLLAVVTVVLSACGPGPAGPAGPQGPSGPSGVSFKSALHCYDGKALAALSFYYDLTRFTDGSVFVSCEVANASAGWQNNYFYASTSKGAADGFCSVGYDADGPASFGSWSFVTSGTVVKATYKDTGSPSDKYVVTLTCE